jgi:hypothetical protein
MHEHLHGMDMDRSTDLDMDKNHMNGHEKGREFFVYQTVDYRTEVSPLYNQNIGY